MRDETSLEHERVFKQLYYHSLPFDQIVYSFLLSLSLFNRKFYQPFSAVPECRNIRCNRKPCNKTQMNHNILLFFSALLMYYGKILNSSLKEMINEWLSPGNIIVYLRLFIGCQSFRSII